MLTICSDNDTTTLDAFYEIHRFLNTEEKTRFGDGVGLELAGSFWVTMDRRPPNDPALYWSDGMNVKANGMAQIALFETLMPEIRTQHFELVLQMLHSGLIDTLHSIGQMRDRAGEATGRNHTQIQKLAEAAFAALNRHGIHPKVYTDHGRHAYNIGDRPSCLGRWPISPFYILDYLKAAGVQFIDTKIDSSEPGWPTAIVPKSLPGGQKFWGFRRYTGLGGHRFLVLRDSMEALGKRYRGDGRSRHHAMLWHPDLLDLQLCDEVLGRICDRGHYCIAAQHLGWRYDKSPNDGNSCIEGFNDKTAAVFRRLRAWQDRGEIIITATSRLLTYNRIREHIAYTVCDTDERIHIDIASIDDPLFGRSEPSLTDLQGICYEVAGTQDILITICGRSVPSENLFRCVDNKCTIVGFRWQRQLPSELPVRAFFKTDHTNQQWRKTLGLRPGKKRRQAPSKRIIMSNEVDYRERAASRLAMLLGAQPPDGTKPSHWEYAIQYAQNRFKKPIEHYHGIYAETGLTDCKKVLDVGCGIGDWSIALADAGINTVGIDKDETYLTICRDLAGLVQRANGLKFRHDNAENMDLDAASFDGVLCHGVLMYTEHEPVLAEVARVLKADGCFYLGYTDFALRLQGIIRWLSNRDYTRAWKSAKILINKYAYDIGLGHIGYSSVRIFPKDTIVHLAALYGLEFQFSPNLQDAGGMVLGMPKTYDAVFKKVSEGWLDSAAIAKSLALGDDSAAITRKILDLIDIGACQVALALLRQHRQALNADTFQSLNARVLLKLGKRPAELLFEIKDKALSADGFRALKARILLKLGKKPAEMLFKITNTDTEADLFAEWRLTQVMARHNALPAQEVVAEYDVLTESPYIGGRALFLAGVAALVSGDLDDARSRFTNLASRKMADARWQIEEQLQAAWTGLLMVDIVAEDAIRIGESLSELLTVIAEKHLPDNRRKREVLAELDRAGIV
jgi:SAM-dependent methyltransferase